ncbi:MAG TPA: c-type cytochrome [Vicinamibacterales bacterium]|nr:c-type cytochrome [Vicinamibacterales bacterium]
MHARVTAVAGVWLALCSAASAQQRYLPAEVEAGGRLYTSSCTGCHGPEGDGVGGINFSLGKFRRASSDDDLVRIIARGIPGTPMAPSGMSESQIGQIVGYLRSMTAAGDTTAANGDASRGRSIVEGKGQCLTCHAIGLNGLHAGPALTDIGAQRRAVDLLRSLVDPGAEIRPENRTVRVVTKDGKTITGRFLNQDTFSIQLIDANDKLLSLDKSTLRESTLLTTSPMPSFKDKLSAQELADVVSYLASLKGKS